MGYLEHRRGARWALLGLLIGQIVGVLASAALLDTLRLTGWGWPTRLASILDVGPSCGLLAVTALGIASMRAPWRFRGRLILTFVLLILLLLEGTLADLEHAVSAGLVLAFGFGRAQRATAHEWRVVAFGAIAVIGVMQLVAALVPTDGPLGPTTPGDVEWWDIAIDVGPHPHHELVAAPRAALGVDRRRRARLVQRPAGGLRPDVPQRRPVAVRRRRHRRRASILWLITGVLLIAGRQAFAVPVWRRGRFLSVDAGDARDRLLSVLRRYGGGTLSWMSTWPRMRVRFGPETPGRCRSGRSAAVAIVLGDPIGPEDRWDEAIADFRAASEQQGVVPCFFSSSPAAAAAALAEDPDWRSIAVGEDTIIDLPGLEFTGGKWQPVRGAANRAEREGHRVPPDDAARRALVGARAGPRDQRVLGRRPRSSRRWASRSAASTRRSTPPCGSRSRSTGTARSTACSAGCRSTGPRPRMAEGTSSAGSSTSCAAATADSVPRWSSSSGQSLLAFRDEGARYASLSGAPLARSDEDADEDGAIGSLLTTVGNLLEPAYGFHSLHRFKQKFSPRTESMRLLYRDEAALPAIAAAIVRAYLPDASAGALARAGLSLMGAKRA